MRRSSGFFIKGRLLCGVATSAFIGIALTCSAADAAAADSDIEQIVVTAQKRSERIQDVPVPVTSLSAATLVDTNKLRLQDFSTSVPGLNVTPGTQSTQNLSIRGITTGGGNPTVGITVDDVPYGSSAFLGGGLVVPDLDPGDLSRVEVLRGPQGTLYGASSMGGLVKFVTVDPSTEAFSGRIQGGLSGVQNGAEVGYNFRGSVNIPVSDVFAIRASGFTRQDPGYIDNPVRNVNGINEEHVSGGRLSALWLPTDTISLKISALYQRTKGDGSNDVDVQPGLGDLQQNYLPGIGAYERQIQAYSATLTAKLGSAELTAVSGYNVNTFSDSLDFTYALGSSTAAQFNGVTGSPLFNHNKTKKFTQEVRLTTPIGDKIEWLVGGFYTHENSRYMQTITAVNSATDATVGQWLDLRYPTTFEEFAGFTDVTFHITDRFDVQVGGRESHIQQTYAETDIGPYDPIFLGKPSPVIIPTVKASANAFTYLFTPRFKVSPDVMLYARLASGYRAGGPNANAGGAVPSQYNPDKTQNYEIGMKADLFDHALSVDASLYLVNWKNIQLSLIDPTTFYGYTANGGTARSQGIEISAEVKPLTGLTISAWGVFNDAVLTQALPTIAFNSIGASGDRLPFSSRFSGNISLQQDFPLWGSVTGFVGGVVSYVGDRKGTFTSTAIRQNFPSYAKADLRTGVKYDTWSANVYVNNVGDKRAFQSGGLGAAPPFAFTVIQPRTFGVTLAKTF